MRIAVLTREFPLISETFVINQVAGLVARGHDVRVFADTPATERPVHEQVRRYDLVARTSYRAKNLSQAMLSPGEGRSRVGTAFRALTRGPATWAQLPEALSMKAEPAFDVIYCHFGPNGLRGEQLRKLGVLSGKLVTVFHGYDLSRLLERYGDDYYAELFTRGDLFLPISNYFREKLLTLGAAPEKTIVHRMGVDCSRFAFQSRRRADGEPTRVISIARFVEKKGLEYAVEAVARVHSKSPGCVEYHIVGDGPLRPEIKARVDRLGVRDQVVFHGWRTQDEVKVLLDEMHLLLTPSVVASDGDTEGLPVVLMEGMAQGLPVLSTHHSGIPELVEDGVSGFLVEERNATQLAERLEHLVAHPDIWPRMGAQGRARVESEFDIETLNDRLAALFEELVRR